MGCYRSEEAMRVAAIDIGTNSVLLLVADVDDKGLVTVHHEQHLPRLGRHVDRRGEIHPSAFDRIAWIVNEYKNLAKQLRAEKIIVVATSAVRDAENQKEFLSYLKTATDIAVEVLSGQEEAFYTYHGVVSGLEGISQQTAVLDIGGGSTEITYPTPRRHNGDPILRRYSFQIGAVRITERFFKDNPPMPTQVESARQFIVEELSQVQNPGFNSYTLIGVAGTITTLACFDQQLTEFEVEKVSGYRIDRSRVETWFAKLASMTSSDIRALSEAAAGREDILTGGTLILRETMSLLGFRELRVSERGLRYGLVLREWQKHSHR
ncbi:MAG: Ppx/GppA family phosphatase [Ignavibacteriae bacterium]|nr:Ppx/GppA family phosphatase [Ignavibacteria bacterium]MBI3364974.1 Ppx/GppA family phosphatase [Ignavibacteriota bacterium]